MVKHYQKISDSLRDWALAQPLFWVASAPLHGAHINVSPKGLSSSTFTIFDATHCAYVDVTGSGAETIAHIYENGRVTLCWASFSALPRILRFYCYGRVLELDSPDFEPTLARMGHTRLSGTRAIILLEVWKVGTSCGKAVPTLPDNTALVDTSTSEDVHLQDRHDLTDWAAKMETRNKLEDYRRDKNAASLDGLPGIRAARRRKGNTLWVDEARHLVRLAAQELHGFVLGVVIALLLIYGGGWYTAFKRVVHVL